MRKYIIATVLFILIIQLISCWQFESKHDNPRITLEGRTDTLYVRYQCGLPTNDADDIVPGTGISVKSRTGWYLSLTEFRDESFPDSCYIRFHNEGGNLLFWNDIESANNDSIVLLSSCPVLENKLRRSKLLYINYVYEETRDSLRNEYDHEAKFYFNTLDEMNHFE